MVCGMPTNALRSSLITALAAGMLPLLAACGGSAGSGVKTGTADSASTAGSSSKTTKTADGATQLTIPDGTDDETKKRYIYENALAACMKKQGFTYTPHVVQATQSGMSMADGDGKDYALAKKYRQKYGFGYYSRAVYPDDPTVVGRKLQMAQAAGASTADNDEAGLTAAQKKAYATALSGPAAAKVNGVEKLGGCELKAQTAAYGPALSAAAQKKRDEAKAEKNRQAGQALNGDAGLVQLAQSYAGCLRDQGITVSTTQPTGLPDMVRFQVGDQIGEHGISSLSKEAALPKLAKEIDLALKDLECGKAFRAAYFPKFDANPYYGDAG
jgi:hypothetical protein